MKEGRIGYAKKKAIENFNNINNKLDESLKITITGDGKYHIIEEMIKQTVDIAIKIYEDGKP